MKILKLKSILFSLMAIAMVTVFLSSCEKNSDLDEVKNYEETTQQLDSLEGIEYSSEETFIIETPSGMSEEEALDWISNLSYEEMKSISKSQGLESRSCGRWRELSLISSEYLGCTCGGKAKYIETWFEIRSCSYKTTQFRRGQEKYVCKRYC